MSEKLNKNLIIIIIAAVLIIAAIFVYLNPKFLKKIIPGKTTQTLSTEEITKKVINYINQNGNVASVISVADVGDVLKIQLKVGDQEYNSYATKDGKLLFPEGYELDKTSADNSLEEQSSSTIGNFSVGKNDICKENGKPIVYFFGSKSCPHCVWEKPILEKVIQNFEGYISFHNNIDSDTDSSIFSQYSNGGIPTLVFGCKYYRVGSGENDGEETETKNLTALLCKITENQPSSVCNPVQDLVNQIKQ